MKFLYKKLIIVFIIGMILTGGIAAYATYNYYAKDISYTKSNGDKISVEDALNELYEIKKDYIKPSGTKTITEKENTIDVSNYQYADTTGLYTQIEYEQYGQTQYAAGVSANENAVANAEGFKTGIYNNESVEAHWINCGFRPRYIVISFETIGKTNDAVFFYKEEISTTKSYMAKTDTQTFPEEYIMEGKNATIASNALRHIYGVDDTGFGFYFDKSGRRIYWSAFK